MMDSRKGYCCRITRTRLLSVPISAPEVKSQSSPLMSALIATKLRVAEAIAIVEIHGSTDVQFKKSLANTFETGSLITHFPERKTLTLPSCNITPTQQSKLVFRDVNLSSCPLKMVLIF